LVTLPPTRPRPLRVPSAHPIPPSATAAHLAGVDLQAPGSADTVGINVFSGKPAPTPTDAEAHRSAVMRAPEILQNDKSPTLALAHGPCQGSVSSAFNRAADHTDSLLSILERSHANPPRRIHRLCKIRPARHSGAPRYLSSCAPTTSEIRRLGSAGAHGARRPYGCGSNIVVNKSIWTRLIERHVSAIRASSRDQRGLRYLASRVCRMPPLR